MSQQQPRNPGAQQHPIKYSDVFPVSDDLADKPVAPQDASMMQRAENIVFGQTQKGGAASVMQSAATHNERAGLVAYTDLTDVAGDQGLTVAEIDLPGRRIITESVAGQVVEQYTELAPLQAVMPPPASASTTIGYAGITIGEALEVSALTAGEKPVEQSDAAAIQAAEVRATGRNVIAPGGVAASAQSAATVNERTVREQDKTKLFDVLTDATAKLGADKVATRQDAEGVMGAELRNNPNLATRGISQAQPAAAPMLSHQFFRWIKTAVPVLMHICAVASSYSLLC